MECTPRVEQAFLLLASRRRNLTARNSLRLCSQPSLHRPTAGGPSLARRPTLSHRQYWDLPQFFGMLCAAMLSLAWIFVEEPCLRRWPGKGEGAAENRRRPKAQCLSREPYTAFESPSRRQDGSLLLHQARHLAEWSATSSPTQWHKKPLTCHPICCCGCACLPLQHLAQIEAFPEKTCPPGH